ncbi:MAG: transglycosylase domain-containing protein [Oligoflexia bacterium]|nr:transglycosylase domain-containing protein [Oligoflexia bacterium]
MESDNYFIKFIRRITFVKIIIFLFLSLITITIIFYIQLLPTIIEIKKLNNHYVKVQVDYKTGFANYSLTKNKPSSWVSIREINLKSIKAIIISEDGFFYRHDGFDVEQIKDAVSRGIERGRWRGASTITQQMVKNLFLNRDKNILRKIKELILAIHADELLKKNKIFEIYLNIIEYGPNLYGISNATRIYFNKHPSEITPREAAFIAMLLPNPKRYAESFRRKRLTMYANKTTNRILHKMMLAHYISEEEMDVEMRRRFDWEVN